jgi:dimethylaniline monooxygenase (N-oxide forming)
MKVLIIGAGPAGLAAAKAARERGLEASVFEMADSIGGVWRKSGLAWPQMLVNISRYTGVFTDFPWDEKMPDFPTTENMCEYLEKYAQHFNLHPCIKLHHRVLHVSQKEKKWLVVYTDNGMEKEEFYDAVIVASGKYGKPVLPDIKGLNDFGGVKLHSSEFHGQDFKGQTVLVVGGSTSGTSISETLAETCDHVIHSIRRPRWIMPRNVPTGLSLTGPALPHDLIKTRARQSAFSLSDHYDYYKRLCQGQNRIPAWYMTDRDRFGVVVADTYIQKIDAGKIRPVKDDISHFTKSEVVFKSGRREEIDSVIFCTGYTVDLSFFDKDLLHKFNLEMPTYSLYKHTFHPEFPNLAFIALTYQGLGAVFPSAELQAAMACEYISGRKQLPDPEHLKTEIERSAPLVEGLQLNDSLASSLDMLPYFSSISYQDPGLYHLLWNGAAVPAQYRLCSGETEMRLARETLEKTESYRQKRLSSSTVSTILKDNYQSTGIFGRSQEDSWDESVNFASHASNDNTSLGMRRDQCTHQ